MKLRYHISFILLLILPMISLCYSKHNQPMLKNTPSIINEEYLPQRVTNKETIDIHPLTKELILYKQAMVSKKYSPIELTLSFVGDCTLGADLRQGYSNTLPSYVEKNGYNYIFDKVHPIFKNDDLTIINLEGAFTTKTQFETEKAWRFKGDPNLVNILTAGSIEVAHIANNHMHDYKEGGFNDTINTLESAGIVFYGNDTMSEKGNTRGGHLGYDFPRIVSIKGISIGFLGYKGWYDSPKNRDKIKRDIEEMKKKTEFIVVTFHWGNERSHYPNTMQQNLAYFSIDVGADLIVGHHPHVLQGIELYKDKYIAYSLGNFAFGGNRNPKDKDTMIFQIKLGIRNNQVMTSRSTIIPCRISSVSNKNNFQPIPLEMDEKERVLNRILTYSAPLLYGIKKEAQ